MTIKKLDNYLDFSLWLIAIVLIILSWFVAKWITAPDYEPVISDVAIPYSFEKDDGDRIESTYGLAWQHNSFLSPVPVAYDPEYDKVASFKVEYLEIYKAKMPESRYGGILYHMFWIWFLVLAIGGCVLVIWLGPKVRDRILCNRIKKSPRFLDCTYFLFHDRSASTIAEVRELVPATASAYLLDNKKVLEEKFSPAFFELIMNWMQVIRSTTSTTLTYTCRFQNQLIDHIAFLKERVNYWDNQRGIKPNADTYKEEWEKLLENKFVSLPPISDSSTYTRSVTEQLKKLFAEIMGSEVFSFCAAPQISNIHYPNRIYVTIRLFNARNIFKYTGDSPLKEYSFPGIKIEFTISHYVDGNERVLWSRVLPPKCTYRCQPMEFDVNDLYANMVVHTIDTFTENLKMIK